MKLGNTVQFNSLKWVMEELRQLFNAVQRQFELYLESADPQQNLDEIDNYLRQIRGTLTLIEIHGAALLSEEMQQLVKALRENTITNKNNAHEVFMRAALKLPDYLGSLMVSGGQDVPFVLLPLLNDLRASRSASLLSENFLFFPNVDIATNAPSSRVSDGGKRDLQETARRARHTFQVGLLAWFRNQNPKASFKKMKQVLGKLSRDSTTDKSYRLWWIATAILDAMIHDAVEAGAAMKTLMGQLDRQIKNLSELGEEDFNLTVPDDLLKNILYYVARSAPVTELITEVQKDFELARFLPKQKDIEDAERQFIGPNQELLNTVSKAIREDINQGKDILDVYVHSGRRDSSKLKELLPLLTKVADTLGMLGLGNSRDKTKGIRDDLYGILEKGRQPEEEALMSIASVLLSIDDDIQIFVEGGRQTQTPEEIEYTKRHARIVSENQKVIAPVVNESLRDIARVKDAFLNYLSQPFTEQPVKQVLNIIKEIKGAMFVPPLDEIVPVLEKLYGYVEHRILSEHHIPEVSEQNLFADVITSVECYLEAVSEKRLDAKFYIESGLDAVRKLVSGDSAVAVGLNPDTTTNIEVEEIELNGGVAVSALDTDVSDLLLNDDELELGTSDRPNHVVGVTAAKNKKMAARVLVNKSYHSLQIIGEDTDEEILEIFLEEALEELGSISELFPVWKQDQSNQNAITTIRRSFHTLKGSGRLVGAALIGEFGWCMENMLNRVIEGTLKVSSQVFGVIDEAIGVLPQLIEQIRGNKLPIEHVFELMARTEALIADSSQDETGRMDRVAYTSNLEVPEYIDDSIELVSKHDPESWPLSVDANADVIRIDELERVSLDNTDGIQLEYEQGDDFVLETGQHVTATGIETAQKKTDSKKKAIDPVLLNIFTDESENHLNIIRRFVQDARYSSDTVTTPELLRALHTLNGSSKTARFNVISEVANILELYANNLYQLGLAWAKEDLDLMDLSIKYIYNCIEHLKDHTSELTDKDNILFRLRERLARTEVQMESQKAPEAEFTGIYEDLDPELVEIFIDEANQLIDSVTRTLQEWVDGGQEEAPLAELMRQLHTLKGGARMASLATIGDLSHALESLLISVAENQVDPDVDLESLLHVAVDKLAEMLESVKQQQVLGDASRLIAKLEQARAGKLIHAQDYDDTLRVTPPEISKISTTIHPGFSRAHAAGDDAVVQIANVPGNVVPISGELLPQLKQSLLLQEQEQARRAEVSAVPAVREQIRVRADKLDALVNFAGEVNVFHSRLSQYIQGLGFNLNEFEQTIDRLRNQLREMEIETEAQVASRYEREAEDPNYEFDPLEMDRYSHMQQLSRALSESTSDLDSIKNTLVDLVRESETALQQQYRVSTELQDELLQTRMVKFEGLSTRIRRIVRQTSRQLRKKVELHIDGENTEIDRSIQDRMLAPLEHMLRNAVYHGIEAPDERVAAGKSETGNIHISIHRDGSYVVLKITDDGRGIDPVKIRAKALEKGLISATEKLSTQELLRFILSKGFSTAKDVSQIAGRGVGMDVVDSEVKLLGGSLLIDSRVNKGTSFVIRLPLTLAINQALLLQVGEDIYAIPLTAIEGVSRITGRDMEENITRKKKEYEYAGQKYRMYYLGVLLGTGAPTNINYDALYPLLLVRSGEDYIALTIDAMAGRREIVVKPVGPQISSIAGISGATILADGRVALILDVGGLVRKDTSEHTAEHTVAMQVTRESNQLTVMVVDDSITIRKVTARILGRHRLRVLTAKDGVDAIEQLQENIPDLFLMDIEMPRMDGFELASHVRSDPRLLGVPIIMITSRTGQKHRDRAEQIGIDRYLGKPFQENELMDEINALLSRQVSA